MSGNCCGGSKISDAKIAAEIKQGSEEQLAALNQINSRLELMQGAQTECCTTTNANLNDIKAKLDTLIANEAQCCTVTNAKLQSILDALRDGY